MNVMFKWWHELKSNERINEAIGNLKLKAQVWSVTFSKYINEKPWLCLVWFLAFMGAASLPGFVQQPYMYDGNSILTSDEIIELSSEGWGFTIDGEYYSDDDIAISSKEVAVEYSHRSKEGTALGGEIQGALGFGDIWLNGMFIITWLCLAYCVYIGVRFGIKKLIGVVKKTKAFWPYETQNILPKATPIVSTKAPIFDKSIVGMVGVREWMIHKGSLLSPVRGTVWNSFSLLASEKPSPKNTAGIYSEVLMGKEIRDDSGIAHRFCQVEVKVGLVKGIIENRGTIIEHGNGILRSEYAKILFLAVNEVHKNIAKDLSVRYQVPVIITSGTLLLDGWPIERKEMTI